MKKKIIAVIMMIAIIAAAFLIGTGFQKRTDVVLVDYFVSEDGTSINLGVQVASSMGYVRGFKDNGGGVKPHYLTFYSTFGGLNSSFGAVNTITLKIDSDDTEIYFNRPNGGYELVLVKDEETSTWIKPNMQENSNEDIELFSDNFWKSVKKVIYYDFDEEIYELSDIGKVKKLQEIFEGMTYKEIENPWIEGWYLFKIQTEKNTYDLNITGKTISFNGKFYEVDDSVAKEIVTIIKTEESTQTNDELATEVGNDYEVVEPNVSIPDFSYVEESVIYVEGQPGVKSTGFVNTFEVEINFENVVEHAKKECTVKYYTTQAYFDSSTGMWKVVFNDENILGGDQTVYMNEKGITTLIVYGE